MSEAEEPPITYWAEAAGLKEYPKATAAATSVSDEETVMGAL
jgi:hypothetical protein